MKNAAGDDMNILLDPMMYIGRVKDRDDAGRVRTMEIIYDDDTVDVTDGDEFFTFRTEVLLEP